jgi:branched-chain amino acid transport system permease protein
VLHVGLLAVIFALQFVLPPYHNGIAARIMVLSVYAIGYNIAFGYTGLLSLGHAMFFSAGMYGAGMSTRLLEFAAPSAFLTGLVCAVLASFLFGLMALRTAGVAFMIVTLMFSQAAYLVILYFNTVTRGDEGFVIDRALRRIDLFGLDLANPVVRYNCAFLLLAVCLIGTLYLVSSSTGRVLVAIRENEERTRMLGNNVFAYKLFALTASGTVAGMSGAAYALLFGYTGAAFAEIQYSILPLLWTLVGGAGTTLGPIFGTAAMFYLVDIASEFTSAYLFFVGLALVLMVLWMPKGVLGAVRERAVQWLP